MHKREDLTNKNQIQIMKKEGTYPEDFEYIFKEE